MACRIKITFRNMPPLYVASTLCAGEVTEWEEHARAYRSRINAAEAKEKWGNTLRLLGVRDFSLTIEEVA